MVSLGGPELAHTSTKRTRVDGNEMFTYLKAPGGRASTRTANKRHLT